MQTGNQQHPIHNLCPKIVLEGTRMTHKTEIAFALNEHPKFIGPRKYRYHSPIISAEWGGMQNQAWGQNLITFDEEHEDYALETFELWIKLMEHMPYISWIVDRFHHSTLMYQKLYHHRDYDLDWIEKRLVRLGFRLVFCYREPKTFGKARQERLKISGNPSQYDDVRRFAREQDALLDIFGDSALPKLIVDATDDNVARITEEIADWFQTPFVRESKRLSPSEQADSLQTIAEPWIAKFERSRLSALSDFKKK
jgi:hypothetical protein